MGTVAPSCWLAAGTCSATQIKSASPHSRRAPTTRSSPCPRLQRHSPCRSPTTNPPTYSRTHDTAQGQPDEVVLHTGAVVDRPRRLPASSCRNIVRSLTSPEQEPQQNDLRRCRYEERKFGRSSNSRIGFKAHFADGGGGPPGVKSWRLGELLHSGNLSSHGHCTPSGRGRSARSESSGFHGSVRAKLRESAMLNKRGDRKAGAQGREEP